MYYLLNISNIMDNIEKVHAFSVITKPIFLFENKNEYKELIKPINYDMTFLYLKDIKQLFKRFIYRECALNIHQIENIVNYIPIIIGKNGIHLKKITIKSNCEFIWFNKDKNNFEIYGNNPYILDETIKILLYHIELLILKTDYKKKNI